MRRGASGAHRITDCVLLDSGFRRNDAFGVQPLGCTITLKRELQTPFSSYGVRVHPHMGLLRKELSKGRGNPVRTNTLTIHVYGRGLLALCVLCVWAHGMRP
jgi:hypothetical protein